MINVQWLDVIFYQTALLQGKKNKAILLQQVLFYEENVRKRVQTFIIFGICNM